MRFLAKKTDDGGKKGKISMYCRVLKVSRQGFYQGLPLGETLEVSRSGGGYVGDLQRGCLQ